MNHEGLIKLKEYFHIWCGTLSESEILLNKNLISLIQDIEPEIVSLCEKSSRIKGRN